jgi:hypothetical protein
VPPAVPLAGAAPVARPAHVPVFAPASAFGAPKSLILPALLHL